MRSTRPPPCTDPQNLERYRAPGWLPGGHLQTIWSAKLARRYIGAPPRLWRERLTAPDGDFIDVDHLVREAGAPPPRQHLVLFHGLEGSSASAYALAFASAARARGWACSLPNFRGCSGQPNLAPRAYHSGDWPEVDWILGKLRAQHVAPLVAAGVSLGGNVLLRWAEETGDAAAPVVRALAAVCAPVDLTASGLAIDHGLNRIVYAHMFLATMKPKALIKLQQYPGLFDRERLLAAHTLAEFDDAFTAPLHGFRDAADYWRRASAKPHLRRIRIPALLANARNDPFVPARSLPSPADVSDRVTLWQPAAGGHVGFAQGRFPGSVLAMPDAVCDWLAAPC